MKKGRFFGLKPIYLLNHSFWLYTCHTFSESCVTKEDRGIEKMMLGVDLKPLGIFSSLRTQTGPWSDTASYPIHHCWCSISPDIWPDCLAYVQFSVENSSLLNLPRLCEHIIPRGMMALTLNQLRQVQTKRCRISGSSPSSQRERLKVPLLKPSQLKIQNWR